MSSQLMHVKGKFMLCRDVFGEPKSGFWNVCGSTGIDSCNGYVRNGVCCALSAGNNVAWDWGCDVTWTTRKISIYEIIGSIVPYKDFTVSSFKIDDVKYGTMVKAEGPFWPASWAKSGKMTIYADGYRKGPFPLQFPNDDNVDETYATSLNIPVENFITVEVEQSIRAARGYVTSYIHDITLDVEADIYVPSSELKYGDLEFDITDMDGNPISGATVRIYNGNIRREATTTSDGSVVFTDLVQMQYSFEITKEGYKKITGTVMLDSEYKTINITMERLPMQYTMLSVIKWLGIASAIVGGAAVGYELLKRGEKG